MKINKAIKILKKDLEYHQYMNDKTKGGDALEVEAIKTILKELDDKYEDIYRLVSKLDDLNETIDMYREQTEDYLMEEMEEEN